MTSEELNHEVAATIAACRDRILGVGHQQYANGDVQTFERLTTTTDDALPEAI